MSDLDDDDASASRPALAAWLEARGLRASSKRTAPNFAHWLGTGEDLRTTRGGGGDVAKLGTTAEAMVGRQLAEPEVAAWLEALDVGKPVFTAGDTTSYLDDLERGCCVLVEAATGTATGPWVGAVFFFADGVEDHAGYAHALPRGVTFADTAATLTVRLGPPESERKRKTGELKSQNWEAAGGPALNITYAPGGAIENVYIGARTPRA